MKENKNLMLLVPKTFSFHFDKKIIVETLFSIQLVQAKLCLAFPTVRGSCAKKWYVQFNGRGT